MSCLSHLHRLNQSPDLYFTVLILTYRPLTVLLFYSLIFVCQKRCKKNHCCFFLLPWMNANMQEERKVFCFQVYSWNRRVILYVLAKRAPALTFEIPSEAPLCFPSVQKFATVHFPEHARCSGMRRLQSQPCSPPLSQVCEDYRQSELCY